MSEERPKRRRRRKDDAAAEARAAGTEGSPADAAETEAGGDDDVRRDAAAGEGPHAAARASAGEGREASGAGEGTEASGAGEGPEAEGQEAEEETEEQEGDAGGTAPAGRRRRGSAETAGGRRAAPAPRGADGDVLVRAQAKYVRCAPRKARLVVDHIRGKRVEEARAILRHTQRHAARDVLKLLESCVSNAENNHELVADELVVHQAYVDEGPTIRRYRPRALGRATRINKRTSHMTLTLTQRPSEE